MADATSARLDAYKANRLIPQEIKLPTPETTESDSQEVVVFTSNARLGQQNQHGLLNMPIIWDYPRKTGNPWGISLM